MLNTSIDVGKIGVMMWAIFRRKVASVGSNALINNGSVQTLGRARPVLAGSTPQGFVETISTHKALNLGMGSKPLRQFHEGAPGHSLPVRNVVPSLKPNFTTQMWSRSFSSDSGILFFFIQYFLAVPMLNYFLINLTLCFPSDYEGDLVDAVVPFMGESITDGTLATFLKKPGDRVEIDEPIAQIETDKVTIDVASPEAGFIQEEGDTVEPGTKVAIISKSGGEGATTHVAPSESPTTAAPAPKPAPAAVEKPLPKPDAQPPKDAPKASSPPPSKTSASEPQLPPKDRERRVPMTRLRKRVATRLKDSQNTFALLTTFNEVDMTNLMKLRSEYKEAFLEKHGVKLGLMSGFVKGLVVPVIRNAETMNFAEIEKTINTLAKKATNGSISIDEMAGGSFTISNGGVYGSLLSTPIINPPQSAILGMHSIVNKPMVVGGEIVSRPMMYIALTYDHRLIDGREAVFFLRRIKDVVEDPRSEGFMVLVFLQAKDAVFDEREHFGF
ncbi:2-oxoacid dehydrogenase acyltransferase, catalytic domain-containing protein [Cynara cardunculus var. scolymus]|uniref:Dihydrolipoamide acetyltransferase component of pyruvate dehydrogenase complex n=1 Tax=Cynara cardunculus var. scolymus TaxID=59895 RepID=A0A103YHV6_CYNCS|nr:2-oxoacid dehydrogenase acyltransferase, catalytic domain-containing protein [Cynara cardunculus var. scolymus]